MADLGKEYCPCAHCGHDSLHLEGYCTHWDDEQEEGCTCETYTPTEADPLPSFNYQLTFVNEPLWLQ